MLSLLAVAACADESTTESQSSAGSSGGTSSSSNGGASSGDPQGSSGSSGGGGGGGEGSGAPVPGLHAEYFSAYHDKVVTQVEPNLDHDWKAAAPAPGVGKDRFSARWVGTLTPSQTGKTTIALSADDGVRLWIHDKLLINDWHAHFVERHEASVDLVANEPVSIRVEYFEADLDASIKLTWSVAGSPEEIIPAARFTTTNQASGLPGPKPPIANPVIGFDCPDPGVLALPDPDPAKSMFYAVCTGGSFPIRSSRDLVTWSDAQGAKLLPNGKPSWAANGGRDWAPEIHKAGNEFLAYYTSVNGANVLSIGMAHAPSPAGPWTDRGSPLVEDPAGVIDATFFEDDPPANGGAAPRFLFYKIDGNAHGDPTPIFVRRLAADGRSFAAGSTPKQTIVNNSATWEGGVVEAPWVVKRNGTYYMFYSGNVYDHRYRTGVARTTNLVNGPWEKKGAPILANNDAWVGPGHGSVVTVKPGVDYFVYHAWQNAGNGTNLAAKGRMVLVDRITWGADGWPTIGDGTPTKGPQPWPGAN